MPDDRPLNLLVLFDLPGDTLERAKALAPNLAVHVTKKDRPDYPARLAEAEIVVGWPDIGDLPGAKNLRWLQLASAGAEKYAAALDESVHLTNASGVFGGPMAEHVFALMLGLVRRIPTMVRAQPEAHWRWKGGCGEVAGTTCGILGLGDIGRAVARRARAFDMRVLAVKRTPGRTPQGVEAVWDLSGLDRLIAEADHLVVTLPGTEHTRHLVSRDRLFAMKRGSFIYNVGRGSVIDEAAMIDALQAGHLAGAGLDVFETEPLPPESPLWRMENVIVSPHRSGNTPHYHERVGEIFLDNLARYLEGEPLRNEVSRKWGY
ncbi:MAG: D-2-hydroxyacid dehydrogenase [Phycisphaeraceae bacterium]